MPFAFSSQVKVVKAPQILNSATEAEWNAMTIPLPANFMAYATDTQTLKIGDGTTLYSALPLFYSAGMVDAVQHIHFVADIAARDALTGSAKHGLTVVLDASGDPTIESGTKKQATYVWDDDSSAWIKLSEQESMDYDFSDFFKMTVHTADNINDGTTKCIMTKVERTKLATLEANAMRYTDTIVIQGVNASELADMAAQG